MKFELDSRLEEGLTYIADLELCQVRMMPDPECPWLILIPKRPGTTEIHQLDEKDQILLLQEITRCSQLMEDKFSPDKINLGALGNIVPQLHFHIIARSQSDRAWPGPIWGTTLPLGPEKVEETYHIFKQSLQ